MANNIEQTLVPEEAGGGEPAPVLPPVGNGHPPENGHRLAHDNGASSDGFSRELLVAMLRFRDGDFSARMPSGLVGLEGKIADAFNDILSVSTRRTTETARVCRVVGKEGKL